MKNKTLSVAIHCDMTEEFYQFLKSRGYNVISIFYGYSNFNDLITYEVR